MRKRSKLVLLSIFSFIVSIAPLAVTFILNWDRYVKAPSDAVKLSLGCGILLIFVILKVIGKMHMPKRIVTYAIVMILAYLLKSLIQDLILLSGMALLGEFVDYVFFQRAIKRIREDMLIDRTADKTAQQVDEVFKKYIGRV